MYETALELLASRDADIQADKQIFRLLSAENISVSEIWKHLIHIKNGSIRFDACKEFLEHQLGFGNLQQTGDVRIMYSSDEIHISLPGEKAPEQKIFVTFTDICRVFNKPHGSIPVSSHEKFLEEYLELLQKPNNIPDLVRLRVPSASQNWSDLMCRIYYIFILQPGDWLNGRDHQRYWEKELEEEKSLRTNKELSEKKCWANQRIIVNNFKKHMYRQLLPFEMPIMMQIPGRAAMPIEDLFTIAGC